MDVKRGEIVLLPFPFDDLTATKTRPALVVSSNKFNQISRTVIVVENNIQFEEWISRIKCID